MNLHQQQHAFYCGIDLHANKMYACIVDANGNKQLHQNFHTRDDPELTRIDWRRRRRLQHNLRSGTRFRINSSVRTNLLAER